MKDIFAIGVLGLKRYHPLHQRVRRKSPGGVDGGPWAIRTYRALVAAWCSAAACSRAVVDVLITLTYRICRLGEDAWERRTGFRGANRRKMSRLFRRHRRMDFLRAYRRHVRRYTSGAKRYGVRSSAAGQGPTRKDRMENQS
jgi:hypothetical protein